eukprot:6204555-Pleurochrysis_carterae.AAC.2
MRHLASRREPTLPLTGGHKYHIYMRYVRAANVTSCLHDVLCLCFCTAGHSASRAGPLGTILGLSYQIGFSRTEIKHAAYYLIIWMGSA